MTLSEFLRVAGFPLLFGGVFSVAYVIASAPTMERVRVGTRGVNRREALAEEGIWSGVEPLVRWLAARFQLIVPDAFRARVDRWLTRAGDPLGMNAFEFFGIIFLGAAFGATAGALHGFLNDRNPLVYLLAAGALGAVFPYLRLDSVRADRAVKIQRGLPPTVDILCLGLSAGLDFPGSVRQFIEKSSSRTDPLVEEFSILLSELQLGKTRREALTMFAERNPIPAVKEFVGSVIQAEEGGMPLARVFRIQAESARRRRSVNAEEAAAKTGIKLMMPMMIIFLSVLIILMGPMILKLGKVMG